MNKQVLQVKLGCYSASLSMAAASNLSPLLFLTFRELYGISYSLLGLLILTNFCIQLAVDLLLSFFSHKFNLSALIKSMPLLTVAGFLMFAGAPLLFPQNVYWGLFIGTLLFSAAAGLSEVLISPVIAALPAKDPDREMSKLHSVYAWGSVGVVLLASLFLLFFDSSRWQMLVLFFLIIPLGSLFLLGSAKLPAMETPERVSGAVGMLKNKGLWLCFFIIFMGGSSELTMGQWSSGYLEQALGLPKIWGDLFGVALFSATLGLGRTLYAKFGKKIERVLFLGFCGSAVCYLLAAVSPWPILGLLACAFTGFCVSMLWPGTLIHSADRFPAGGVFIYALLAAGGDLGASVGPQLVGIVTDLAIEQPALLELAQTMQLSPDQFGMKLGMLVGMLFPLCGIFLTLPILRKNK